jgi:hypothetical protein
MRWVPSQHAHCRTMAVTSFAPASSPCQGAARALSATRQFVQRGIRCGTPESPANRTSSPCLCPAHPAAGSGAERVPFCEGTSARDVREVRSRGHFQSQASDCREIAITRPRRGAEALSSSLLTQTMRAAVWFLSGIACRTRSIRGRTSVHPVLRAEVTLHAHEHRRRKAMDWLKRPATVECVERTSGITPQPALS